MSMSMNTALSQNRQVGDIQGHPQGGIRALTKLVKITEAVRRYATGKGLTDVATKRGLEEKTAEFRQSGAQL